MAQSSRRLEFFANLVQPLDTARDSVHNCNRVDSLGDRVSIPGPGQTVHLMNWRDVLRVLRDLRRQDGRSRRELELYTTDDLRRLYQATNDDPIRLRDGIVSRVQVVAVIQWRNFWAKSGYFLLLLVSVIAAVAAVIAAVQGWK